MSVNLHPVYLQNVIKIIEKRVIDEEVKRNVIKEANKCPHAALGQFLQRLDSIINDHIRKINLEKRSEQDKMPKKAPKTKQQKIVADDLLNIQDDLFEQLEKEMNSHVAPDSELDETSKEETTPAPEEPPSQDIS